MYLVTSYEMKEIDRITTEEYKISTSVLMENAGANVVMALNHDLGSLFMRKVYVFCGQGNNGGDGFVVARHAKAEGAQVKVFVTGDVSKFTSESKANFDILEKYGVDIVELNENNGLEKHQFDILSCDIIVDALLGTGINKNIEGFFAKLIVFLNTTGKFIVSIDMPSGINADTGDIMGVAIYANMTITFGLPKIGLSIYPGLEYVGKLVVADITFPQQLLSMPRKNVLITKEIVIPLLPYRQPNANKGHFGPIFVLGGSPSLIGAAILTGKAALKTGAGIVTLGLPTDLCNIAKSRSDEIITIALKETADGCIAESNYERILEVVEKAKVLAIGPGIGRNKETQSLIRKLIKTIRKPMVIDADGLNAIAEDKECLQKIDKDVILTPHIGEMSRLVNIKIEDIIRNKIKVVRDFVKNYKVNVLLKDGRSILADTDSNIYINTSGNSGMATPGSGDVLTGIIAALMAHDLLTAQAGIVGNYLHGLAGDILCNEKGGQGIIAGDLIENIPRAIKSLNKL